MAGRERVMVYIRRDPNNLLNNAIVAIVSLAGVRGTPSHGWHNNGAWR